jgi:AcrR family transcriptional regulator
MPDLQRARSAEAKQQREQAILDAAAKLGAERGIRQVTLTDIATAVGMHKSAMLRYFETREQIFLELTAASWRDWTRALHAELDAASNGSAELVADVVARSFADRPLLCDLIPHTALNLERNVSPAAVRRYKLTSLGAVGDAAGLVRRVLPELTEGECLEFISAMASLAGALWQIANPPPALAELYATDPDLGHACVDLLPRLRRTAAILLAGLIPSRAAGGANS